MIDKVHASGSCRVAGWPDSLAETQSVPAASMGHAPHPGLPATLRRRRPSAGGDGACAIPAASAQPRDTSGGSPVLRLVLAGLRGEFAACGVVEGFDVLIAVLARTAAADQTAGPVVQAQDAHAMQLQVWARQLRAAVGPGRDGAELACLYGHDDRLDTAIDAVRCAAAARMLRQDGLPDARAQAMAQAIVTHERRIALAKLDILRLLAPQPGFVPALHGLRITPALVQGLSRANPAAAQRAGVLIGAVLADEHALSSSPEVRCMLRALRARLQATPCADDRAWLERRAKALQPQITASGLAGVDMSQLTFQGAEPAMPPALLQDLAARGLTGLEEVQQILSSASRVLAPIRLAARPECEPAGDPASVSLQRFMQRVEGLEPGKSWTWKLNSQIQAISPLIGLPSRVPGALYLQAGAQTAADREVQISCDESGCELVLRTGRRLSGEMGMEATLYEPWPARLEAGAVAGVAAGGHRSDGVLLRFPATETGRGDMKRLLQRLIERGRLDLCDIKEARQVMPVAVRERHTTAHGGIKLDIALAGLDAPLPGSGDAALGVVPALESKLRAGIRSTTTRAQNSREQIHEHRRDFTITVEAEAGPEARLNGIGMDAIMALPGVAAEGAEFRCSESFRHELHGDGVAAATQRSVRVAGAPVLLARAVERCGGKQLRAVASYLRASSRAEHHALRQAMAGVLGSPVEGDEVRIVWRIAPQTRVRASDLLREAQAASAGQAGHAGMKEAYMRAARLREQARAVLDDSAGYQLHALERMDSVTAIEELGGRAGGSNANLLVAKWGTLAEVSHERRSLRVVFEPALVRAALSDAYPTHRHR